MPMQRNVNDISKSDASLRAHVRTTDSPTWVHLWPAFHYIHLLLRDPAHPLPCTTFPRWGGGVQKGWGLQ